MEYDDLDDLYREAILDHTRHPRNRDPLEIHDAAARSVNPFCGDEVDLELSLDDGKVVAASARAVGCSINRAATSMLSEVIQGLTHEEIAEVTTLYREAMMGTNLSEETAARIGQLRSMMGVRSFPVRIKCALLALNALDDALTDVKAGT